MSAPPALDGPTDDVTAYPARIERANNTEMLALAKDNHAFDAAIFDEQEPFFWRALISSDRLDSYHTSMKPSSLKNYAADAEAGVSFQNSHRSDELPIGRSIAGKYTGPGGNGIATTRADFYTLRGLNLNGLATDQFINGVRSGIVRDVSIGFYGGNYRCTICNRDPSTDWNCWHYPGIEYELVDEKSGKKTGERQTATFDVENAHLAEVSAVYDGSCPGAMIQRAARLLGEGRLSAPIARMIEQRYRIHIPGAERSWAGAGDGPPPEERTMPDEPIPTTPPPPEPVPAFGSPQLRALMEAAGLKPGESDEVNFRSLSEVVRKLPAIEAERERLAALADDGKQYRAHLIDSALKEGVRAYGAEKFPGEQYRAQFENAPLEFVRTNLDLWTAMGDVALKGGRQTVDQGEPDPTQSPSGFRPPTVNPAQFRA